MSIYSTDLYQGVIIIAGSGLSVGVPGTTNPQQILEYVHLFDGIRVRLSTRLRNPRVCPCIRLIITRGAIIAIFGHQSVGRIVRANGTPSLKRPRGCMLKPIVVLFFV